MGRVEWIGDEAIGAGDDLAEVPGDEDFEVVGQLRPVDEAEDEAAQRSPQLGCRRVVRLLQRSGDLEDLVRLIDDGLHRQVVTGRGPAGDPDGHGGTLPVGHGLAEPLGPVVRRGTDAQADLVGQAPQPPVEEPEQLTEGLEQADGPQRRRSGRLVPAVLQRTVGQFAALLDRPGREPGAVERGDRRVAVVGVGQRPVVAGLQGSLADGVDERFHVDGRGEGPADQQVLTAEGRVALLVEGSALHTGPQPAGGHRGQRGVTLQVAAVAGPDTDADVLIGHPVLGGDDDVDGGGVLRLEQHRPGDPLDAAGRNDEVDHPQRRVLGKVGPQRPGEGVGHQGQRRVTGPLPGRDVDDHHPEHVEADEAEHVEEKVGGDAVGLDDVGLHLLEVPAGCRPGVGRHPQ